MPDTTLQTLDVAGLQSLLERAAEEGWNPGTGDARAFHRADPDGYRARLVDGRFAAGISVVRQDADHAFLGLYIADPAHRGQGHGMALWRAALAPFDGGSVGLDGVVAQQANYARSGFVLAHRNVRWSGKVTDRATGRAEEQITGGSAASEGCGHAGDERTEASLRAPRRGDRDAMLALDAAVGGLRRERFIDAWCLDGTTEGRDTLVAERAGELVGLGTIRRCRGPHKIGPLIATDAHVARSLLQALVRGSGAGGLMLDVPEPNRAGTALAEGLGLAPVFETARMYRGGAPIIDTSRLFGVATLELG